MSLVGQIAEGCNRNKPDKYLFDMETLPHCFFWQAATETPRIKRMGIGWLE
jgi:hypothetical protein